MQFQNETFDVWQKVHLWEGDGGQSGRQNWRKTMHCGTLKKRGSLMMQSHHQCLKQFSQSFTYTTKPATLDEKAQLK